MRAGPNDRIADEFELAFRTFLRQVGISADKRHYSFELGMHIALEFDGLDQLGIAVIARKPRHRNVRTRQQFGYAVVLAKQQNSGDSREEVVNVTDREQQIFPQKIAGLIKIDVWRVVVESARKTPQQRVVEIILCHGLERDIFKPQRT